MTNRDVVHEYALWDGERSRSFVGYEVGTAKCVGGTVSIYKNGLGHYAVEVYARDGRPRDTSHVFFGCSFEELMLLGVDHYNSGFVFSGIATAIKTIEQHEKDCETV